jgi:hypothetical protein
MPFLVYIKRNGRIYHQKWEEWPAKSERKLDEVVQKHQLNRLEMMSTFRHLLKKYPFMGDGELTWKDE